MLYVFDPKAMHTIAVKEAYVYDEAQWFLKYPMTVVCAMKRTDFAFTAG